jgi:hypothetical protein
MFKLGNRKAKSAIKSIIAAYSDDGGWHGWQSSLREFLTDVRHLSDDMGLDFREAIDGSEAYYLEGREVLANLKPGGKVFWNDPDGEACSRGYVIKSVKVHPDFVKIEDVDGSVLECHPNELTTWTKSVPPQNAEGLRAWSPDVVHGMILLGPSKRRRR